MAELTKDQIAAAKARGAAETPIAKNVKVTQPIELNGLGGLVEQLRMMAEGQQRSQQILIEAVMSITNAIETKDLKTTDVSELTKAVKSLKQEVVTESNTEWTFDITERDQRGYFKSGRFTPGNKVLN